MLRHLRQRRVTYWMQHSTFPAIDSGGIPTAGNVALEWAGGVAGCAAVHQQRQRGGWAIIDYFVSLTALLFVETSRPKALILGKRIVWFLRACPGSAWYSAQPEASSSHGNRAIPNAFSPLIQLVHLS
jgi:hypothetical protein